MSLKNSLARLLRDEQGQDMVEYALLAAFISIVAITALQQIGTDVGDIYDAVSSATTDAATAAN